MTDVESTAATAEHAASCAHCGHELAATDQICPRCWRSVPGVAAAVPEPQPAPPAPTAESSSFGTNSVTGSTYGRSTLDGVTDGGTSSYFSPNGGLNPGMTPPVGYRVLPRRSGGKVVAVVVGAAVLVVMALVLVAVGIPIYLKYHQQAVRNTGAKSPIKVAATSNPITIPPSPGSARPAPTSTAVPPGVGVVYRSAAGHFAARFPTQPTVQSTSGSVSGVDISVNSAYDTPSRTMVLSELLSEPVPSEEQSDFNRGALKGFAGSTQLTERLSRATTFRGHAAQLSEFRTSDGSIVTALSFMATDTRAFVLLAPTGSAFAALTASLVIVP